MKKSGAIISLLLFFSTLSLIAFNVSSEETSVQFSQLQEIINNAEEGSTIYLKKTTYHGVTKVNKSLTLIGEGVFLDANGWQVALIISASNVTVEGFTILNASRYEKGSPPSELSELWLNPAIMGAGICVYRARNATISNVAITNCYAGIGFTHSGHAIINSTVSKTFWGVLLYRSYADIFNCVIKDNTFVHTFPNGNVAGTGGGGIWLDHYSQMNLTYSTLQNTNWAITILPDACYNWVNRNNFVNNTHNVFIHPSVEMKIADWDGNFWSDYNGTDLDLNGVGDTAYIIDKYNQDNFPLMEDPLLKPPQRFFLIPEEIKTKWLDKEDDLILAFNGQKRG